MHRIWRDSALVANARLTVGWQRPSICGECWTIHTFDGRLWWVLSVAALMWATVRLDPFRVGILLMTEVVFGAVTSAVFAGESLSINEMVGGAIVIMCGLLEVWPTKRARAYSALKTQKGTRRT